MIPTWAVVMSTVWLRADYGLAMQDHLLDIPQMIMVKRPARGARKTKAPPVAVHGLPKEWGSGTKQDIWSSVRLSDLAVDALTDP